MLLSGQTNWWSTKADCPDRFEECFPFKVSERKWCPGRDLNPHSTFVKKDFKSFASAGFATRAFLSTDAFTVPPRPGSVNVQSAGHSLVGEALMQAPLRQLRPSPAPPPAPVPA